MLHFGVLKVDFTLVWCNIFFLPFLIHVCPHTKIPRFFRCTTFLLAERALLCYSEPLSPALPMDVRRSNLFILDLRSWRYCKISGTLSMVAYSTQVKSYKRNWINWRLEFGILQSTGENCEQILCCFWILVREVLTV